MTEFSSDQIGGPRWIPNTANYSFAVTLPDGRVGLAIIGMQDAATGAATPQRAADALNFQVQGRGYAAVVEALAQPGGLPITLRWA